MLLGIKIEWNINPERVVGLWSHNSAPQIQFGEFMHKKIDMKI
jgi:hypothetical protein